MPIAHIVTLAQWLVSVSYGLAGVTDVTLASTLVFVFHRSRTGSKRCVRSISDSDAHAEIRSLCRTDSVLDTLIIYTINTGTSWTVRAASTC